MGVKKKFLTKEEAVAKLQRYCAYQDRCHSEVKTKLIELGVYGFELEEVMSELIVDKFLNEERFACSFAGGKFRIKKWGRVKISIELKRKRVSPYCIKKAMKEIPEEDYLQTLEHILEKKRRTTRAPNEFQLNSKLAKYAIGRGFESYLVWSVLKKK